MTSAEQIRHSILEMHGELTALRREVNDMRIEARRREDEKFVFLSEKEKHVVWDWFCKVVWGLILVVLAAIAALALLVGVSFVTSL